MKYICLLIVFWLLTAGAIHAQTTAFSYQGRLTDASAAASGNFDFEFAVFDANSAGTQQGATLTLNGINVAAGIFTAQLDFGSAPFAAGADRFLEVRVKKPTDAAFTTLAPRQKLTSAPYSIQSSNAANSQNLGGIAANQYVLTTDSRLDANNYVQNATTPQPSVNFSIGGTGAANIFDAATQYNIGGSRILGIDLLNSTTFVGISAGASNTSGIQNVFVGSRAGNSNTSGRNNSFFGVSAGRTNTDGQSNAFFGSFAGQNNTASNNTFFGASAGSGTTSGSENTFVGRGAGLNHTVGRGNTFIGDLSGFSAASTSLNTNNTLVGSNTRISPGVFNSTAIGTGATVSTSNTIVIGTGSQQALIGNVRINNTFPSSLVADNLIFRRLGLDIAAASSHVCFRLVSVGGDGGNGLTSCINPFASSESKKDIQSFEGGLDIVKRLKPVAFKWKTDEISGIGLNAEDVAAIAPQIVTRNEQGAIQDVNENSLTVVLINAVKEQQKQIEAQKRQIDALVKLVCAANPNAAVCQEEQK